jgi:hypothetical protein
MPTYLLHGFRWHRPSIRIHIILNDLEDAAAEWIVAPATSISILNSFYTLYDFLPPSYPPSFTPSHLTTSPTPSEDVIRLPVPDKNAESHKTLKKKNKSIMSMRTRSLGRISKRPAALNLVGNGHGHGDSKNTPWAESDHRPSISLMNTHAQSTKSERLPSFNEWSVVKLVEQYDPDDMMAVSQPYAYVADYMVEVSLGVSITEEMSKYETKLKGEDGPLSTPSSPGVPATAGTAATVGPGGALRSPGISARDLRRKSRRLGWFEKLRDGLQKEEHVGWFVVVCGDEERASPSMGSEVENLDPNEGARPLRKSKSTGFRGFFKKGNVEEDYGNV